MSFLGIEDLKTGPQNIDAYEGWPGVVHDFSEDQILAVQTALAAGRPLLVRGEPGTGKTQFARAAAATLGRHFVSQALDAHTEARDLFWTLDGVHRLSEAQVRAAMAAAEIHASGDKTEAGTKAQRVLRDELAEARFVEPGVLWWAFNWGAAADQEALTQGPRREPAPWVKKGRGAVVLLDEIDKADPVLPNALLEALSVGRFDGPRGTATISKMGGEEPLVVITTNEERKLPYAFMRRCAVLDLRLPTSAGELRTLLVRRGRQHGERWCKDHQITEPSEKVLERAATLLLADREYYRRETLPVPGQAEFLDLLRAVCFLTQDDAGRLTKLNTLKKFILDKHARRAAEHEDV